MSTTCSHHLAKLINKRKINFKMCHLSRYAVFLIYSSMFLLPLSFSTYRIFRNPCRTDTLFRLQDQDSKLNSNKILSVVVASLSHCARNCLREPNCLSINYNPWISPQTNCEILAGNKSSNGAVLEASTGWKHYSPVTQEVISLVYPFLLWAWIYLSLLLKNVAFQNKFKPAYL